MRFWAREIVGWALVLLGLFVLFFAFLFLLEHYIIEGGPLTFIGIIIFRGGIHLLKVSVAARVCLQTQEKLNPKPVLQGALPAASRPPSRPVLTRR
jgi:hypothetical protein